MQTNLADFIRETSEGIEADAILRRCVHCGFCLATCPTYQVLGDELDSPRGRIYLIKQMLEGEPVTEKTQLHLDRCLTCRACETTCPSGVEYGKLIDIGRHVMEKRVRRSPIDNTRRFVLRKVLAHQKRFNIFLKSARVAKPLLLANIRKKIPGAKNSTLWPTVSHQRKMLLLEGCVQPSLEPEINIATARVLDALDISLVRATSAGCCGAISYHLNAQEEGLDFARRNIDAWWPLIEEGIEAIVVTASGCGTMIQDYGRLLKHDPSYAEKANVVSKLFCDISQVLFSEKDKLIPLLNKNFPATSNSIAFHSPCSLQHGLKIRGVVEDLLKVCGYELTHVPDSHLCCGSAGTYSLLQPDISQQLLTRKVNSLESGKPEFIATANIGCLTHIASESSVPVKHWIEFVMWKLLS